MNRSRSVSTLASRFIALLLPLLGFALLYGLPMLGMKVAVDHGWYVAAASAALPIGRHLRGSLTYFDLVAHLGDLDPSEDEILDHGGWMIDEIHAAAVEAGREPERWRGVPIWTLGDVDRMRASIVSERAELGGEQVDFEADDDEVCPPLRRDDEGDQYAVVRTVTVGAGLALTLEQVPDEDGGVIHAVTVTTPSGSPDAPEILADDIPALIAAIVDLHETARRGGAA